MGKDFSISLFVLILCALFLVFPQRVSFSLSDREPVTFHISFNGGSLGECLSTHPCRDINQAIKFALPGDTILIHEGDYQGFRLQDIRATQDRPFTIKGIGKVRIYSNKSLSDVRDNIQISNCDWVTIDNIQSFDAIRAGIRVDQSHHVTIRNSIFGNNTVWGIYTNHSNDLLLENNRAFGSKEQHGIYFANSADRPIIRGNRVYSNVACGIHMNGDLSMGDGRDVVGDGIISGAIVENNVLFDNGRIGGSAINGDGIQDSIVRNNVLFNNHSTGIALFKGNAASGASNVKLLNNTIDMPNNGRWAIVVKNSAGQIIIMNNILINQHKYRGSLLIGESSSVPKSFERIGFWGINNDLLHIYCDFNIFSGNHEVISLDDGATSYSLRDWQKKQDKHSIFVDRALLFVNPEKGNYHLLADSVAIDHGTALPDVPIDIEGVLRPKGNGFDIGAYEDH